MISCHFPLFYNHEAPLACSTQYGGCSCILGVVFALFTLPGSAELVHHLVPGDVLADLGWHQLGGWDVLVLIHVSSSFSLLEKILHVD